MTQPHLFDRLNPAAVDRQRDEAIRQVAQHAEEHAPSFGERAGEFILSYLRQHGPTPGEVLTLAAKDAGIRPHNDKAFGGVYMSLARRGQIVKAGAVRRERGHGTSGGNVWRAVAAGQETA